jgi:hypothetical protein
MAPLVYLAAGDLVSARRYAQQRRDLPFFREADHLAVPWLVVTAALTGDFDEAVEHAERFRQGWVEAGRPTSGGLAVAPAAAAMAHGIRGDDDARHEWLSIAGEMRRVVAPLAGKTGYSQVFDGLVALHRGDLGDAVTVLSDPPQSLKRWHDGAWRHWYAAIWAETAVLAELGDRGRRLHQARILTAHNPIASPIVDRAEAVATGDRDKLLAAAAALDAASCRYQYARTLIFAGGDTQAEGEAILAAIGAAPMSI